MQHLFMRLCAAFLLAILSWAPSHAAEEDGYQLWLRYRPLPEAQRAHAADSILALGAGSATVAAAQAELRRGLQGLLGKA
ncbi:MAG: alpha-glucuronidase, partial [Massilia sp.]|nr:alpha-glucuronidase [Massilia sp.]